MSENVEVDSEVEVKIRGTVWAECPNEDFFLLKDEETGELIAVKKSFIIKKA